MSERLYLMEVVEWGKDTEPWSFGILASIPFSGNGVANEIHARGRATSWPSVSKRYFHPSPADADNLSVARDAILFISP